ncbi:hypothetical protein C8R46DRAFT_1056109, partial [Mycena filopes]
MMSGYNRVVDASVSGVGRVKDCEGEDIPATYACCPPYNQSQVLYITVHAAAPCACCLPSIQSQVFCFALFAFVVGVRSLRKKPSIRGESGYFIMLWTWNGNGLNVKKASVSPPTTNSGPRLRGSWERWPSSEGARTRKRGTRRRRSVKDVR